MFTDIDIAKAEPIGQHDFINIVLIGLRCTGVRAKTVRKESKIYDCSYIPAASKIPDRQYIPASAASFYSIRHLS